MSRPKSLYRVSFLNQGKVYEIYARKVHQEPLYGFVTLEELVFGAQSEVVVDPGEERLKSEFAGVSRSFVPMHAIIRIDEVAEQGGARIRDAEGNVTAFPGTHYSQQPRPPR